MKTNSQSRTLISAILFFFSIAVMTSCSSCSQSGRKMEEQRAQEEKEGLRAATPEKSTPEAFDLDLALDNNTLYKDATRIMYIGNDPIAFYPLNEYESYDQEKTIHAIKSFVGTLEKIAPYIVAEKSENVLNPDKKLSVAILNTERGHYVVDVYKSGDRIGFVSVTEIESYQSATTGASPEVRTSNIVAMDTDGNGFLNPEIGKDQAMWPAKMISSFQFFHQTKEQHAFANAKYLQLLSYLERIVIKDKVYSSNNL
jgi:hypothetical protein